MAAAAAAAAARHHVLLSARYRTPSRNGGPPVSVCVLRPPSRGRSLLRLGVGEAARRRRRGVFRVRAGMDMDIASAVEVINDLGFDTLTFLGVTVLVVPAFRVVRASPILGFFCAGVVLNQFGLIRNLTDVKLLSEWGILFLLFEMGLELSLSRLKALARYAFGMGLPQVLLSTLAFTAFELPPNGAIGTKILQFLFDSKPDLVNIRSVDEAIVIGAALSLSSSAFVLQLLAEKGELPTRFGSATLGILLLQDIAVVPLLVILPVLESQNVVEQSVWPMLVAESLKALGGLGLLSLGGKYLIRRIFEFVAESRSSEAFVALCLLTVSGTSLLTQMLGFSDTLGAFLAGAILAETNFRTQIEADIRPFRGLLLGLFFVTTGTSIDMQLLIREWPNVLSLLGGLVAIKTLIITAIGPRVGLTLQESIRIGLLLSQGGEFGFVVFSLANRLGVLPLELNKLLIIVVVLSMALTPLLNEIGRRAAGIVDEKSETKEKPAEMMNYDATEPIVILGFGEMGKVLAKFLSAPLSFGLDQDAEGWPYVAFDLNPAVVKSARKSGFPVLYGDGSRPAVLQSAGISSPKAVMVMYTGKEKTIEAVSRLRQTFPGVPMYARAQDMSHLLDLKKAGATEVVLENAETSLQLGSILLKGLGVMSDDVSFLSKLVRDSMELQAQEALNNIEDREIDIMKPLQIYDCQHNLGLILLERKELTSKYEQLRASSESAEIMHKRERASQQSALAEARKREESLKKNLGIQKECVANLEKALHDMRGETAELKVSYETKLVEALQMMEDAQKKFDEAEEKLLSAKSLEAESTRTRNAALRSLQDMEDREDQLRRYRISCEFEYETKENEINLQRKSLNDTKKILHEKEQVLLKEQALLNQRDENILERLAYITHSEKRLEEEKLILEAEQKVLLEEKNKLDLKMEATVSREEAVIQKESILDKRESELLIFQETIASKERAEIERLSQEQEIALERRKHEFETEIENKRMSFDAEMKAKRTLLDQRESALNEQESAFAQRDQNVDLQLAELANKEVILAGRSDELKEEEGKLFSHREALQIELQKEREEIQKMKLDLEKEKAFFEEEKREAIQAQQNLAITQADRDDLLTLQMKLKEEIDSLRAQKKELMADADRLQAEKERFEIEWELIDEKKEELQKEAVRIAEERRVITEHLKNESDIIKQEKDNLRVQFKNNSETLSREHEEFMSKMQQEHASWLSNIQQEREDLKRDIDIQRMELLNSAKARHMEIDSYLREREEEFEQKKSKELEYITSQKEMINSKLEHVAQELQKLEDERKEATLERERREQELSEIKSTIEALNNQREKLQEQRKLLHSDREAITEQIQQLNLLEELKIDSENNQLSLRETRKSKLGSMTKVKDNGLLPAPGEDHNASPKNCSSPKQLLGRKLEVSPAVSTPISWVRKCAQVIFKRSPEKSADHVEDSLVQNGVPTKLGKAADINNSLLADQLGNGAGEVPRAVDGAKVGKKRLNYLVSCDQSEVLEPRRKQRRSTIQKANGGEITSNSPYVLEECSKNEHDAAPLGLSGACKDCELDNKGPENLRTPVDPASSDDVPYENGKADNSDFVDDDEPSEEIAVSATEPSNGDGLEDKDEHNEESDDEDEEEEKTSSAKKLWRFLIT